MILNGGFLGASLAVIVVPGPDLVLLANQVLAGGRRSGLVTAGGIMTGGLVHASLSIAGVAALLSASPASYTVLRSAGGTLLALQGVRSLIRARRHPRPAPAPGALAPGALSLSLSGAPSPREPRTAARTLTVAPVLTRRPGGGGKQGGSAYLTGLTCNLLNVRVLLFLAAFLPQFLAARRSSVPALCILAGAYLGLAALWLGLAVELVARAGRRLESPRIKACSEVMVAGVLIALGLRLAHTA